MKNLAGNRSLASRYARALLDVTLAEKLDARKVETDLSDFVSLLDKYPQLRHALSNPAVPAARKLAVVSEITARSTFAGPLEKLLKMMAGRDNLALLQLVLVAYRRRLMDRLGIVNAEVTTAAPMPDAQLKAVQHALSAATGKQVTMTTRVNPAIIGGVVAKVDSTVYDGSVARQLERIRQKMTEGS